MTKECQVSVRCHKSNSITFDIEPEVLLFGKDMGITIGMCGVGVFAECFIPLFKAHPEVDHVILSDLDPEKLQPSQGSSALPDTRPSLDDLCNRDVDAIVIITQHHLHGPQAVQALRAGKHVYSAVPSALTLKEGRSWCVQSKKPARSTWWVRPAITTHVRSIAASGSREGISGILSMVKGSTTMTSAMASLTSSSGVTGRNGSATPTGRLSITPRIRSA